METIIKALKEVMEYAFLSVFLTGVFLFFLRILLIVSF